MQCFGAKLPHPSTPKGAADEYAQLPCVATNNIVRLLVKQPRRVSYTQPSILYFYSYDAVGAYDWTDWNPPFPDTINFGVAIGKRNATFWHHFQRSMQWFIDKDWSWNGLRQPYRIKERHPELIQINPRLQVSVLDDWAFVIQSQCQCDSL